MTKEQEFTKIWDDSIGKNGCFQQVIAFAVVLLFIFLSTSCATKTKIEYRDRVVDHYNTVTVHDTTKIKEKDSTYHFIRVVNDTVYDTKYVEKTRWRDRIVEKHDTCWRDSVVTEYKETAKEVVKYPKTYWYAVGVSVLFLIFAFIKLFKKFI